MNIQKIEEQLRSYFASRGVSLPGAFPCPEPQHSGGKRELKSYFDHTQLKQAAGREEYEKLYDEALEYEPFSVCIPSSRLPRAALRLKDSPVKLCTVVGFPWGYDATEAKVAETVQAIREGADEIDMVIALGFLKDGDFLHVYEDIRKVVRAADGRLVKVILETSELSDEEIVQASFIAGWAGAWFIKTSTGFASGGASVHAVKLMREVGGSILGVKASGGIRNREFTLELIDAGADRIGASATAAILTGSDSGGSGY